MPKLTHSVPRYCLHRPSGKAFVRLNGKQIYLGPWKSRASKLEYDRLIGEWLADGRRLPGLSSGSDLTVVELCAKYWAFAKRYYTKNGKPTGAQDGIKVALRFLKESYGHTFASGFGPVALRSLRQKMVDAGHSRRYANDNIDRLRRVFRWAVSEELVPSSVYESLRTVQNLRKGRTEAREPDPVKPVADNVIETTLPFLPEVVADMVRIQRLTGCRPNELCIMRPCDIDRSDSVWAFTPESHKTEHHGRWRVIFIGPRAQAILGKYLDRDPLTACFSAKESEARRRQKRHSARKTPLNHGNRPGTNRRKKPARTAGESFSTASYRRAIHRGCDRAFPPVGELARKPKETVKNWMARMTDKQHEAIKRWQSDHRWSPNQLRHAAATEIRKNYGLEAVQVTLGHASADVSQIYAERDMSKARQTMQEIG